MSNTSLPTDADGNGGGDSEQLPPGFEPDFQEDDCYQATGVQVVEVNGMGEAAAQLVDFGDMFDMGVGGGSEVTITPDRIAEIIRDHYHSPSYDGLTGEKVRKMKPTVPGALLDAIMDDDSVDVDMNADGSATVSTDQGNR